MEEINTRTAVFWDMMPRSFEDESHHTAETCCLHHLPCRWRQQVLPECYCSIRVQNHV